MKRPGLGALLLYGAVAALLAVGQAAPIASAATVDFETRAKLNDAIEKTFSKWAATPALVQAAKGGLTAGYNGMTSAKWAKLKEDDALVRDLTSTEAGRFLAGLRNRGLIIDAFASEASGGKVALVKKTPSWSDKGNPQHDLPMAGKSWVGPMQSEKGSNDRLIPVSVPILDGGTPVGSLVLLVRLSQLQKL